MALTLIPLKDKDLAEARIPIKAKTLYKWRNERRNTKIFTKIGGRVFVVKEKWEELIRKGIGK